MTEPLYLDYNTGNVNCQEISLKDYHNKWESKKKVAVRVSKLMKSYDPDRALNIANCGNHLTFAVLPDGKKKLQSADFCRERMCPMCQWRRALKLSVQADKIFKVLSIRGYRFIFVTLTIKNCTADNLNETCDLLYQSYKRLEKTKVYLSAVKGAYRALEITYNAEANTYHPHFHCLWAVEPDYFTSGDYITMDKLIKLWKRVLKVDYDPSIDIETVKQKEGQTITSACVEACKYPTKFAVIKSTSVLQTLDYALRGRRLVSWTGILKMVRKELKLEDVEQGSLIHADEEKLRTDKNVKMITYVWRSGVYLPIDIYAVKE